LTLRRYATDWVELEVCGSDRIDAQLCDLTMKTGPAVGAYPIGPEFQLRFEVTKHPVRAYLALLLAIAAAICVAVGGVLSKDHLEFGIGLILIGVILGVVAYYLWSRGVKIPGGK
jgi:hypothetical protein